jgi:hypothetical protein
MGSFYRFDPSDWIEKYKLVNYVELGFGDLTSFKHALNYNFAKWYGVDLDKDWCSQAQWLVSDYVTIVNDYSTNALKLWSKEIFGNSLIFMDSHFYLSDYRGLSYEESIRTYKRDSLPLEDELNVLIENRDISRDVIIIDDVFLYIGDHLTEWSKQNPFKHRDLVKELGIDLSPQFIYDKLSATHNIEINTQDQGYLIATPK